MPKNSLHDRIDPPAHADLLGERIGIDGVEVNLLLDHLLLHLEGQPIPHFGRFARGIQQEHGAVGRVFEHVDFVDEFELMAGDETGFFDQIGRPNRSRTGT